MQAAIDGDADKAVRLLQAHVRFTADTILKNGDALQTPLPEVKQRRRRQGRVPATKAAARK